MMTRTIVGLVAAVILAACGGAPPTAMDVAEPAPDGVDVERTVTGPDEVAGYLAPPGVRNGLESATHKIGGNATYTVYQYETPEQAETAMNRWGEGQLGSGIAASLATVRPAPDRLGESAYELGVGTVHRFVVHNGKSVVSMERDVALSAADELSGRLR